MTVLEATQTMRTHAYPYKVDQTPKLCHDGRMGKNENTTTTTTMNGGKNTHRTLKSNKSNEQHVNQYTINFRIENKILKIQLQLVLWFVASGRSVYSSRVWIAYDRSPGISSTSRTHTGSTVEVGRSLPHHARVRYIRTIPPSDRCGVPYSVLQFGYYLRNEASNTCKCR